MSEKHNDPVRPLSADEEIDEELAQHLELLVARNIAKGMTPEAARSAARARFGDAAQLRDELRPIAHHYERKMRLTEYLTEFRQDIGFALRTLRRAPLFTAVAVLTLAVAIGANTAMFSVVHRVLLRSLPYANAERSYAISNSYPGTGLLKAAVSPAEFADLKEQLKSFDELAALRPQPLGLTGDCGGDGSCEPQRVSAYNVSPNLFTLLGARAALGTTFRPEDGSAGAPATAVLSHSLWVQRFGGDPRVIGRSITTAGVVRTVIGVMPPEVRFPDVVVGYLTEPAELWLPYSWERNREEGRGNQYLVVLARAKEGAAPEQLRAELDLVESRFKSQFPARYTGPSQWRIAELPLRTEMVGEVRPALLMLWSVVGLVLLIACANVANLLLARSAARETEMAVRAALGAGRGRIVRQLLAEALVLGLVAGSVGLLLGALALGAVRTLAPPNLPQVASVGMSGTVLLFALAAAFGASVLCGLLPAIQLSRSDLQVALRSGVRGLGGARAGRRLRRALVVGEVALTLVVLVSSGLLLRSFIAAQRVTPPFDVDRVLSFELSLPRASYPDAASIVAFHAAFRANLAAAPGVRAVSAILPLPLDGGQWSGSFYPEGRQPGPNDEYPNAQYNVALPGYFAAMRLAIREGREFTDDDAAGHTAVAIVNEALAAKYWPGEDALGKRINTIDQPDGTYSTIIAVVPNVRRLGATEEEAPQIYVPFLQKIERRVSYVVRTEGDPLASVGVVREVLRGIDAGLPVARIAAMEDLLAKSVAPQRFNAALLGIFAAIALLLAGGGLFGVVSYLVTQRDHELGVRMALGGRPADILRLVIGDGMAMAGAGIGVGLLAAWFATRALRGLLFGVSADDPATWFAVALLLGLVSFLASWVPARRATRVDPAITLRSGG